MDPKDIARLITEDPDVPNQFVVPNPEAVIRKLVYDYDGEEWDGYLYRVGPLYSDKPTHFHVTSQGASNYGENVQKYDMPIAGNVMLLNLDDLDALDLIYGMYYGDEYENIKDDPTFEWEDIAIVLYKILPKFKDEGFNWVIVDGETGRNLAGPAVEVVKL
jgi:hypothetical protein